MSYDDQHRIYVCDSCHSSACLLRSSPCRSELNAGVMQITKEHARSLGLDSETIIQLPEVRVP